MEEPCNSCSSSIDSSSYVSLSSASSHSAPHRDLSTELKLGLSLSAPSVSESSSRDKLSGWPPIGTHLRSRLAERDHRRNPATFFVKVYMEGIPIGRKLDLFTQGGYGSLIRALQVMFGTTIICTDLSQGSSNHNHVLTYEDKDGDWMMVGDVPWEIFLTTVKRLKITRVGSC